MKSFTITELLIYDPKRPSPKRKPIQIDIQQAKILVYWPENVPIEQKCNTVGMAEGVFSFCHSLYSEKQIEEQPYQRGWQVINMNTCALILSEVQEDIWILVKIQHEQEPQMKRTGQSSQAIQYPNTCFSEVVCRNFMDNLYSSIKIFYGSIRGWVFKERIDELQAIINNFVIRYQQVYKYQNYLDILAYTVKDIRLIPLDINSTLKFHYFKNVLQSYDKNIAHLMIFSTGLLAYSTISKESTQYFANYFYGTGQPYLFSNIKGSRLNILPQLPKAYHSNKFGYIYNSRAIGLQEGKEPEPRSNFALSRIPNSDLLGISQGNRFQLFQVYLLGEQGPFRVNFYIQNALLFVTFLRENPEINQIIFQNRFFHDNADKFILKINESLVGVLKPNDPYKFLFHNSSTYSGKSTIKEWKSIGNQIRQCLQNILQYKEGVYISLTSQGYWIYGVHRFCRVLILLISTDISLNKIQEYTTKMTKEYFTKAYI